MAGVLQAVPEEPDTEIILESTANGLGGLFYSMCKAAERGESEYILIFLPWFWHDEYRKPVPEGWQPPRDFQDYAEAHGLDPDQLYWAYSKNRDLAQSIGAPDDRVCWKFRQEYPGTARGPSYCPGWRAPAERATCPSQGGRPLHPWQGEGAR